MSSGAAVVSYMGFLLENQEKHIFGRGTFTIEKCYYCSYNAFRKMDLQVEISVPETGKKHSGYSIAAYAVDASGNKHEATEAFWKETHICAMMRLINGPPANLRPIRVDSTFLFVFLMKYLQIKDSLKDPVSEAYFLSLCAEYFPQGSLFFVK